MVNDRTRDQLGEKRDKQAVVQKVVLLCFSTVCIY